MRRAIIAIRLIGLLGLSAAAAAAEPSAQWLAGVEASSNASYAYLGHLAPLAGSTFGNGFIRKLWVDWSSYRYDGGSQTHDVKAPGAEIALGYQRAHENNWWAAYAGLNYRHSSISPDDPANKARGSMLRPKLELEGEQSLAQAWKLGAIGSYITGQQAYWTRGRLLRDVGAGRQIGLEAVMQGDPSYHAHQLGLVLLGINAGNGLNVGFKLGVSQVAGLSSRAYVGMELGGGY